jgi:hypothetical protein
MPGTSSPSSHRPASSRLWRSCSKSSGFIPGHVAQLESHPKSGCGHGHRHPHPCIPPRSP